MRYNVTFENSRNKYRVRIRHEGQRPHVGYFDSESEAHAAGKLAVSRMEQGLHPTKDRPWFDNKPSKSIETKDKTTVHDLVKEKEPSGKEWLFSDDYIYTDSTDTYVTFLKSSPKPLRVPGSKHKAMIQAYSNWDGQPSTINEVCRTFGMPRQWFIEYCRVHGWTHDKEPFTNEELLARDEEDMIEEVIQNTRLNLFQKYEKRKYSEVQQAANNWWEWEEYGKPRLLQEIAAIGTRSREGIAYQPTTSTDEPYAIVFSPWNDLHFGKRGSKFDVRHPYNRAIARQRVMTALSNLIKEIQRFGTPDLFIIPVGSDMMHIDNGMNTTTKGTRQDTDGSYREIKQELNNLVIEVFNTLFQYAPVHVYVERGNHDEIASFETGEFLRAWYHSEPRVTIDIATHERQYARYGTTLVGFNHGDKAKPEMLVRKMAQEQKHQWHTTEHKVILVAHLHNQWMNEIDGVLVCRRPCLSGSDLWHEESGYTGNAPVTMGMIVYRDTGPRHHLMFSGLS